MTTEATNDVNRRVLVGEVVSTKMDKTIAVRIDRQVAHPIYGKYVRKSTKFLAHDEGNECKEGDTVAIEECRPLSKRKSWRLQKIIERAVEA
jgi:small subunit ribosomal protein S17